MKNSSVTDSYKAYYESKMRKNHNNLPLLDRWGRDPSTLETQILCRKQGTKVADSPMYECDGEKFGPQRWPYNAKTTPSYSDPPIQYIIDKRMRAVGSTWWDWKNKRSIGLGFDFDSLIDHNEAVGIPQHEIDKLDHIDAPWLEVIRSTRGNGRHIYIWFDPDNAPRTVNHDEHSAVARSFIPLIARATGMDIEANVDCCGSVLWFYHENATKENQGYALVKPATQILTADHVPPNWRDNLEVVSGGRSKVRVQGWAADGTKTSGDELDEMTQAHAQIELDDVHLQILEDLEGTGHSSLWVHDHHLWQGHTAGLKQVFDDWADRGSPMRGLFDTNSMDSDPGKPNCFMRPKDKGGWDVYRFGDGTQEAPIWDTQGKWTHTTYNYQPTLKQICLAAGGYEGTDEKQGFMFSTQDELKIALQYLGCGEMVVPDKSVGRSLSLHSGQGGKVILVISKERSDQPADFPRYVKSPRGWEICLWDAIETSDAEQQEEQLWSELDDKLRVLKLIETSPSGAVKSASFDSWVIQDDSVAWVTHPRENVKSFLMNLGFAKPDPILGGAVFKSWALVNEPFQPEYPGGRVWNRDAAQFRYAPVDLSEGEFPHHPHWDMVMEHCGCDLDQYIAELTWPKEWGIETGGDYLKAWVACMLRNPYGKLPYLFMYGPQGGGKSSFHESVALLLTRGVVKADRALTSQAGYNGELRDAILAVVDEVDISKAGMTVYNKLKEWTTGLTLSIHAKYKQVQEVTSTLHFVQMSNSRSSLPVFPGDTRITAFNVPSLESEVPKDLLLSKLKEEAPAFMRTMVDMEIPDASSRLMIPIIETQGKADAAAGNLNEVEAFINEKCFPVPGSAVTFKEFKDKFIATLEDYQMMEWGESAIKKTVAERFPIGRAKGNTTVVGNISFTECEPSVPYVKQGQRLVRESE
jgi:hypothetical protein